MENETAAVAAAATKVSKTKVGLIIAGGIAVITGATFGVIKLIKHLKTKGAKKPDGNEDGHK